VTISGVSTSAPERSERNHVRNTRPTSSRPITSPSHSDVGPKQALMPAAITQQATTASTSRTRARSERPFSRRRSTIAATTTATVLPTVWASTVPSGVE
jgi:hypothetical protein